MKRLLVIKLILILFLLPGYYIFSEIIFVSNEVKINVDMRQKDNIRNLFLLDTTTGNLTPITKNTENFRNFINTSPSVSIRQDKIAFSSLRECSEGFLEKEMLKNKQFVFPPLWFPVDKYFLSPYEIKATSRCGWNLYTLNLKTKEEKVVTLFAWDEVKPVWIKGSDIVYSLNSDGMHFLFETQECGNKWWWLSGKPNEFINYDFSIDREKIVYQSFVDGNWEIFKMNIKNLERERLTFTSNVSEIFPEWSYDREKILYLANIKGRGFYDIFIMNSDGSGKKALNTGMMKHRDAKFSPDGRNMIFSAFDRNNWDLYKFDINADKITRLTNTHSSEYNATFSPDGTEIAYIAENGNKYYLYGMRSDGNNQRQLTQMEVSNFEPIWF